ncbi:MAG: hypothetical protein KGV57_01410 [Fusobacterium sp.]|nr:hypothetical protein [Fusobacterium sp.]
MIKIKYNKTAFFLLLFWSIGVNAQVVFLHGYGSNENQLKAIGNKISEEKIFLNAPFEIVENLYKWFEIDFGNDTMIDNEKEYRKSILEVEKKLVDLKEPILVGYSQGGFIAGSICLKNQKFNRLILLNSYLNTSYISKLRENFSKLEVLLIYDENDFLITKERFNHTIEILEKLKIKYIVVKHKNYHKYTHNEENIIVNQIKKWKKKNLLN